MQRTGLRAGRSRAVLAASPAIVPSVSVEDQRSERIGESRSSTQRRLPECTFCQLDAFYWRGRAKLVERRILAGEAAGMNGMKPRCLPSPPARGAGPGVPPTPVPPRLEQPPGGPQVGIRCCRAAVPSRRLMVSPAAGRPGRYPLPTLPAPVVAAVSATPTEAVSGVESGAGAGHR